MLGVKDQAFFMLFQKALQFFKFHSKRISPEKGFHPKKSENYFYEGKSTL